MSHEIFRFKDVIKQVNISRGTIYLHIKKGTFPKPIKLGPRAVGFLCSDIDKWIDERIEASKPQGGVQ